MGPSTAAAVLVAGSAVSLASSIVLVTRLERLGERLGLTERTLGLVAALAADGPEITSSVAALAHGQRDVSVGVVLGSNVFNLAALLGLGALVAGRIALHRRVVAFEGAVALALAALALAAELGWIAAPVALGLALAVTVPYVAVTVRPPPVGPTGRWRGWLGAAVQEEEAELEEGLLRPSPGRPADTAAAAAALAVVVVASVAMERAATSLGGRLGVPGIVTGGVVLAAITSLPNAVAAVHLARRGRGAATLSEAMNSNTINVVAGLLLPAAVTGAAGHAPIDGLVAGWYGGLTLLTLAMAYALRGLWRWSAVLVIAGYAGLVALLATR